MLPIFFRLAHHARDQIDIDLRKSNRPRVIIRPRHFFRTMRAPVDFENMIVEIFDPQAQPRHAMLRGISGRLRRLLGGLGYLRHSRYSHDQS